MCAAASAVSTTDERRDHGQRQRVGRERDDEQQRPHEHRADGHGGATRDVAALEVVGGEAQRAPARVHDRRAHARDAGDDGEVGRPVGERRVRQRADGEDGRPGGGEQPSGEGDERGPARLPIDRCEPRDPGERADGGQQRADAEHRRHAIHAVRDRAGEAEPPSEERQRRGGDQALEQELGCVVAETLPGDEAGRDRQQHDGGEQA